MITGLQAASLKSMLGELTEVLPSNGLNYCVSFFVDEVRVDASGCLEIVVTKAFGKNAKIGGVSMVAFDAVWPEMRAGILWNEGGVAAGPSKNIIESGELQELVEKIGNEVNRLVGNATLIQSFWLEEGHPFYPVYWEFAFIIWHEANALILLGSSSD